MLTPFFATRKLSRDCRSPSWATSITAAWRVPPFTCSANLARTSLSADRRNSCPNRHQLAPGLHITRTVEDAVHGADVVMTLRVQKERLAGTRISLQDYIARYQMTMPRLKLAKKDAMLMHPGPIIRGLELTWEVADCPQSAIVEEVRNGVPVRMAILAKALGKAR